MSQEEFSARYMRFVKDFDELESVIQSHLRAGIYTGEDYGHPWTPVGSAALAKYTAACKKFIEWCEKSGFTKEAASYERMMKALP